MKQQTKKVIRYHYAKYQTRRGNTKMNKKKCPLPFYDSPLERILIAKWGNTIKMVYVNCGVTLKRKK